MRNILNRNNKGFTLIELLVVIAIIGILAAVVLVSLNSARAKSRDARRLADIRQMMTALELFYNDNGSYPDDAGAAPTPGDGSPTFSTFLQTIPTAPTPEDGSCSAAENTYTYSGLASDKVTADATDPAYYELAFCIGGNTGGFTAGVVTASPAGLTN